MCRVLPVLLVLSGCGSAVAYQEQPSGPVAGVWAAVFERQDEPPAVEWRDGDCNGPELGRSVWDAFSRTMLCLGGQAMHEHLVWVASWPGATLADREMARRVAHEMVHAYVMRLGVYDGDFRHEGPEWGAGGLEDQARAYLQR